MLLLNDSNTKLWIDWLHNCLSKRLNATCNMLYPWPHQYGLVQSNKTDASSLVYLIPVGVSVITIGNICLPSKIQTTELLGPRCVYKKRSPTNKTFLQERRRGEERRGEEGREERRGEERERRGEERRGEERRGEERRGGEGREERRGEERRGGERGGERGEERRGGEGRARRRA